MPSNHSTHSRSEQKSQNVLSILGIFNSQPWKLSATRWICFPSSLILMFFSVSPLTFPSSFHLTGHFSLNKRTLKLREIEKVFSQIQRPPFYKMLQCHIYFCTLHMVHQKTFLKVISSGWCLYNCVWVVVVVDIHIYVSF